MSTKAIEAAAIVVWMSAATYWGTLGSSAQADGRTTNDGVYTEAQAARGKELYNKHCATCHEEDLSGKAISDSETAKALKGDRFLGDWIDVSVADFFSKTKTTMPMQTPGSLAAQEYVDMIAYILKANNFPAGQQELPPAVDALKAITITKNK
jgi:mono/diheme cytochrome c family protein